jgi:hypothetical protein
MTLSSLLRLVKSDTTNTTGYSERYHVYHAICLVLYFTEGAEVMSTWIGLSMSVLWSRSFFRLRGTNIRGKNTWALGLGKILLTIPSYMK